jgi:hypothetical protein
MNALFRRGATEDISRIIVDRDLNLAKLAQLDLPAFIGLGLERGAAERIRGSERPRV